MADAPCLPRQRRVGCRLGTGPGSVRRAMWVESVMARAWSEN